MILGKLIFFIKDKVKQAIRIIKQHHPVIPAQAGIFFQTFRLFY